MFSLSTIRLLNNIEGNTCGFCEELLNGDYDATPGDDFGFDGYIHGECFDLLEALRS